MCDGIYVRQMQGYLLRSSPALGKVLVMFTAVLQAHRFNYFFLIKIFFETVKISGPHLAKAF